MCDPCEACTGAYDIVFCFGIAGPTGQGKDDLRCRWHWHCSREGRETDGPNHRTMGAAKGKQMRRGFVEFGHWLQTKLEADKESEQCTTSEFLRARMVGMVGAVLQYSGKMEQR